MPKFDWFDRNSPSYPAYARVFALLIALFVGFLTWAAMSDWPAFWLLIDGRPTTAIVIERPSRKSIAYSYSADGEHYTGQSRDYQGSSDLGGDIQVYYSASHPWLSASAMPPRTRTGLAVAVPFLLFLLCEILAVRTIIHPRGKWTINFSPRSAQPSVSSPAETRRSALLMAVLLLAFLGWTLWSIRTDYWLAKEGRTITATIDSTSRGSVGYRYTVAGDDYDGFIQVFWGSARKGNEIQVYYSASHPWLSSPTRPATGIGLPKAALAFLLLFLEVLVIKTAINPRMR